MSAFHYGPSLSDQGIGPEDMLVGHCANCAYPLDVGDMEMGGGVYDTEGTLYCADCVRGERQFAAWFAENYPAGSTINDPAWHAKRIWLYAGRARSEES